MMFLFGAIFGFGCAMFFVSYAIGQIEDEAYMEGFKNGLEAGDENGRCKVDQDNNGHF